MKIAIIGAGATGLNAAWELKKQGHDVTLFEKEANAGGLARGFRAPQWQDSVELYYHHWFKSDATMMQVMAELGLKDKLVFRKPKSVMFYKGKFYPFDTILAALLYPGLGFGFNKIGFGLVGLYLRLTNNWRPLEKVTAEQWMIQHAGASVYRSMWEPMMIGKFGEAYASKVNMAWLWARIHSRTTELGTFAGGFQAFFDAFAAKLEEKGAAIRFNTTVKEIHKTEQGDFLVRWGDQEESFDLVAVTTSPQGLVRLVPQLPRDYQEKLQSLISIGAVVMVISLKHPLSKEGYYWYNLPKNEGFPCLALVEHTNFVPRERFGGETILYAGDYLPPEHEHFSMSKEDLLKKMIPGLKKINPEFSEDWVIDCWKNEAVYAQPIPLLNHSEKIPPLETPLPGLYLASMSQVYPWDRGTNYALKLGIDLSRVIM